MKRTVYRLFRLGVFVGSLILLVALSQSLYTLWKKKDIVRDREAALARVKEENTRLQEQLKEVQTPEFIERQAREKLGLVKDGEVIVLVGTPMPVATPSGAVQSHLLENNEPTWKQWWRLFF